MGMTLSHGLRLKSKKGGSELLASGVTFALMPFLTTVGCIPNPALHSLSYCCQVFCHSPEASKKSVKLVPKSRAVCGKHNHVVCWLLELVLQRAVVEFGAAD